MQQLQFFVLCKCVQQKMHIRFFFMCFPKFISFFVVVVVFLELFSLIFVILNPEISLSLLLLLLLLTLSFFFISIFCIFNPIFFYIWFVCLRIRLFHFFSFIQSVFSNILFTEWIFHHYFIVTLNWNIQRYY